MYPLSDRARSGSRGTPRLSAPILKCGAYSGPECATQTVLCLQCAGGGLHFSKTSAVHHACLCEQLLSRDHALHCRFNLAFYVVALIQHECDIRKFILGHGEKLMEYPEYLIRIDRSQRQVVICVVGDR